MERVSLIRSGNYDPDVVRTDVERLLEPLGGIAAFVSPGERVLLKPNLLAGKNPEKAVTTHPAIVQAVAGLVRDAGGVVLIGDSPGIGGFQRVAEKSGIAEAARVSGATLVEFGETVELQGSGTFRRIHLARAYLEADKVINLPKLKTHEMMTMTCAVKNLFGAVVGTEKAGWHLKAGASRRQFARLLLEIYLLKKPVLTIVDGIVAMEGNGPGSGDPVELGVLLAGCNPVAVDVIAGRVAGIPPDLLYVEQEARVLELPGSSLEEIELIGAQLDQFAAIRFRLPSGLDAQFGLPGFLAALLKKQLTTYPVADVTKCVLCGVCRDACPPAAITIKNSALSVDNARCIRCWCCRELCPHDAMAVKQGRLLRLMKLLGVGKVSQASSSSAPRGISR
ncbi:MAG TPA: DUF362 domain-containing protein [Desulfuromonadales bacterium]|nr:DUF362 domain-containing protein [Desulfuromonadales bacterium]